MSKRTLSQIAEDMERLPKDDVVLLEQMDLLAEALELCRQRSQMASTERELARILRAWRRKQ